MKPSKINRFFAVFFLIVFVALFILGVIAVVARRYVGFEYRPFASSETADELDNPYQGFYGLYGYMLSDDGDPLKNLDSEISKDGGRLVLLEINLSRYAASGLSTEALNQLETVLEKWTQAKKQIILRFLYDWDGKCAETEPTNISVILAHISQTCRVVNDFKDSVYIVQGIYVGDYGEMHGSQYMSDSDVRKLCSTIHEALDESIFLAVRTPSQWKLVTRNNSVPVNFPQDNGSLISRLSLYNDGMFGSETDLGTYPSDDKQLNTREKALAFQNELCAYVPNGGEAVIDNPLNDFENAVADLAAMRISYLNSAYDGEVLEKWRNSEYKGTGCFSGVDGYTYIKEHLGYRYALRSTRIEFNTWFDDNALFSCVLENVGFSSCMKKFDISVVVESKDSDFSEENKLEYDLRTLKTDGQIRLTSSVPVREYDGGDYNVYFRISDPATGEIIKLATDLELTEKGYFVGEFTSSKLMK